MAKRRKWGRGPQPDNPPTHVEVVDNRSEPFFVELEKQGDDGPDMIDQEPVVTKRPLVYLSGRELRDAHVEILTLRALKQPIPEHLSINDRINVCGMRAVRQLYRAIEDAGRGFSAGAPESEKLATVREFAERAIPVPG